MVYEQTEILDNIRSYYEKSYKSTESNLVDIELGNLFNNYNIPKLDNETANGLEHDILENEELRFWKKWKIINPQEWVYRYQKGITLNNILKKNPGDL